MARATSEEGKEKRGWYGSIARGNFRNKRYVDLDMDCEAGDVGEIAHTRV